MTSTQVCLLVLVDLRKHVFQLIQDKMVSKLKAWKEHTLSKARKEVLLKAVVQAVPTYTMSYLLFPICICKEIDSVISRFWQESKNGKRKIHWVGWERMTTSKESGGLGLRNIHCFNLVMLVKQVWRIRDNLNSLVGRILKAKYFPRVDIDEASVGYQRSFLW